MSDAARPIALDAHAATEAAAADYSGLDAWPAADILRAITASNRRAVDAVERALPELERAVAGVEERLRRGGRLIYAGAGTSGRLGLQDAAELAPTFGFDHATTLLAGGSTAQSRAQEGAEDDVLAAAEDVAAIGVGALDALVGVAASGATPYTVAAVRRARALGAFTVGIANNPDTPLLTAGEVGVLLETGPEVLAGSTRLAAGTAQKVALNALSTTALVRLGGAYENLMVGMRPVNAKLRVRAVKIVAQGAQVDEAAASTALEACGGNIRCAIVAAKADVSAERARAALADHADNVRLALRSLGAE
ncbi:MAG TPA: N-acetylmuramic acid 6-phosphate etherase [Trueperaceae bacterium]|nr:N-acetylmuramic acid 6-phosphate etherase [Trueperaceae bacterium]